MNSDGVNFSCFFKKHLKNKKKGFTIHSSECDATRLIILRSASTFIMEGQHEMNYVDGNGMSFFDQDMTKVASTIHCFMQAYMQNAFDNESIGDIMRSIKSSMKSLNVTPTDDVIQTNFYSKFVDKLLRNSNSNGKTCSRT